MLRGDEPRPLHADDGFDCCYAPDAGRAIALLTTEETLRHDTYNVSSGRPATNREFADALRAITPGLRLDLLPGRQHGPGDDPYLDITRLTNDIGFAPAFDVAAAVADYVAWRADNPAEGAHMLDPDVRRVLDGTSIAHLATVLPDGSPHATPVWTAAHGDRVVFLTGPGSRKARNLRRDPRLALSIAPVDNPFEPVVIRGRVVEWLEGDAAWEIIDQLSTKYIGAPYPRAQERVVAVIEPERQTVGVG